MEMSLPQFFSRNNMGKTRAKKAQLRRARQEEQLVATIPLPGTEPRPTAGRARGGGGEPWPTGTQVSPRTYAMAAGGREACCSCPRPPTETLSGAAGSGNRGHSYDAVDNQPAPRPAKGKPSQAAAQQGGRRPGHGGAQQGPLRAGASQGDCRAPAKSGGRATDATGGTQQGHRRAAADSGGCARVTGGTQQGPRRAAAPAGGRNNQPTSGTDEGPHGDDRLPKRRNKRLRKKRPDPAGGEQRGAGTLRPGRPLLPEERPAATGGRPKRGPKKKARAHANSGGNRAPSPDSTTCWDTTDDNDSAIVVVDSAGGEAEGDLRTSSAPGKGVRSAPAPATSGPVFLPPYGGRQGWQIPRALPGATFDLLKELNRYNDFRLRPRGQGPKNLWRYLHQGLRRGKRAYVQVPADHGAVSRLRQWTQEFGAKKQGDGMAAHPLARCECAICEAEVKAFCDLIAPIAKRKPAIEYGPDGGFYFNEPFSFRVTPDYCSSPHQLVISWARADNPVWREVPTEEPTFRPTRRAAEDDGLSDVLVFSDEGSHLGDLEEEAGPDPNGGAVPGSGPAGPETGTDTARGNEETERATADDANLGAPVPQQAVVQPTGEGTTTTPAPSDGGFGPEATAARRNDNEEPDVATPGERGEVDAGVGETPAGPRPPGRADAGLVRATRLPESAEPGETRVEVHLFRPGGGGAPEVAPDNGRRRTAGRRGRGRDAHAGEFACPGGCRRRGWFLDALIALMQVVAAVALLLILIRLPLAQGSVPLEPSAQPMPTNWGQPRHPWDPSSPFAPPTIEETHARQQEERRRIPRGPS